MNPQSQPAPAEAPPKADKSLDRVLVRGIAWTGAAKYATQILRWASTFIVVRLLTPDDYGIFGMAEMFVGLVALLTEFGVGTAVVTLRELDRKDIAQLNTVAVLFGVTACLLTFAAAKPLALFYSAPELVAVLLVLGAGFVIRSFRTIPAALLERELRFKLFAFLEGVEAVVLSAVMILFAAYGFGYWTLVLGNLLSGVLGTAMLLVIRRHGFAWPRLGRMKQTLIFSWHIVASRLTWYWYSNADYVVAGRCLGKGPLGVYTFGYRLAMLPVEKITALVGRVTPAFFAAVQDDDAALRRYLLTITEAIAVLTIPACWGIAAVADTFVPVVLGEHWMGAIVPLQLLAGYAAWRSIEAMLHTVLVVKRETRFAMWNGIRCALVLPVAFYVGQRLGGTPGIATAWIAVHPILLLPLYQRALQRIDLPVRQYLGALWPTVASALVMVALVLLVRAFFPFPSLGARLGAEIAAGAAGYAGTMLLCFRERVARFKLGLKALRQG